MLATLYKYYAVLSLKHMYKENLVNQGQQKQAPKLKILLFIRSTADFSSKTQLLYKVGFKMNRHSNAKKEKYFIFTGK